MADSPDYTEEQGANDISADEYRSAKDILGPDTFRTKDRSGRLLPGTSQGQSAVVDLRGGATPAQIMESARGAIHRDINLQPEKVAPLKGTHPVHKK